MLQLPQREESMRVSYAHLSGTACKLLLSKLYLNPMHSGMGVSGLPLMSSGMKGMMGGSITEWAAAA